MTFWRPVFETSVLLAFLGNMDEQEMCGSKYDYSLSGLEFRVSSIYLFARLTSQLYVMYASLNFKH